MSSTQAGPRIGSLCTGYGGLDMAVREVFGGSTAWHAQYDPEDKHQYAARILAHHWPTVPNHGDITTIDYSTVEPVDILTAGFPCQDVSLAGQRAGLTEGTRSGLWAHVARGIEALQPRMVVIENVEGLLSADAHGDLEPCTWCLGDRDDEPVLRALGAVLGDLADLGFDAEWTVLAASDVGACHQRKRVFVLAWPAASDAADLGHQWCRDARHGRPGPADRSLTAPDADGSQGRVANGHAVQRRRTAVSESARLGGGGSSDSTAADPAGNPGRIEHGDDVRARGAADRRDATAGRGPAADSTGFGHGNARQASERGLPAAFVAGGAAAIADADGGGRGAGESDVQPRQSDIAWGRYAAAIARHERVFGHPVPAPADDLGRLNPAFTEWTMMLASHVTSVPGLTRNAQLKALGNGVVPAQAAAALRLLLARIT